MPPHKRKRERKKERKIKEYYQIVFKFMAGCSICSGARAVIGCAYNSFIIAFGEHV